MINLIIKGIVENSNKIDTIIDYINTNNKKYCLLFGLITVEGYILTKTIKSNRARIIELENEVKEMKSKGE